jgi:hypothetical protein
LHNKQRIISYSRDGVDEEDTAVDAVDGPHGELGTVDRDDGGDEVARQNFL